MLEVKGKFTPQDRSKMLHVRDCHPDRDVRMVFMRNNWLTSKKRKRYGDWCEFNNLKWCVGPQLPEDWIREILGE